MSRTFLYARVSTTEQNTENQAQEVAAAGFTVEPNRIIAETVSGSTAAASRTGFNKLLERMERGDVLIVTKLDRLGRDTIDVISTIAKLEAAGVRVHCLQLGGTDLTSATGKLTMTVLSAVAEFERNLIIERTNAGLARAVAEGKALGRPTALTKAQQAKVRADLAAGAKVAALARQYDVSRMSIMRIRDAAAA